MVHVIMLTEGFLRIDLNVS